jgi:hypothetical protein
MSELDPYEMFLQKLWDAVIRELNAHWRRKTRFEIEQDWKRFESRVARRVRVWKKTLSDPEVRQDWEAMLHNTMDELVRQGRLKP